MNMIPDPIRRFLKAEKFATISCIDEYGAPYCFNCMYVFDAKNSLLFFKSSTTSRHSALIDTDPRVAGTILPVKPDLLALKGIQFTGRVLDANDTLCRNAVMKYHMAFPLAVSMSGKVFVVEVNEIKLTDNSIGFGKKVNWNKNVVSVTESVM